MERARPHFMVLKMGGEEVLCARYEIFSFYPIHNDTVSVSGDRLGSAHEIMVIGKRLVRVVKRQHIPQVDCW